MSEFSQTDESARERVEAYIAERQEWLGDAVEIVTGDREADPLTVFPEPPETRANAVLDEAMEPHIDALREVATRFGVGAEQDVPGTAEVRIVDGGKPWKIEAEAAMGTAAAQTIIFAGSANRKIGTDEQAYLAEKYEPETDLTEYDVAELVARNLEGYEALEIPVVMPFGYELDPENSLIESETGQLTQIGSMQGKPVMLLRVDREDYVDDTGAEKYRFQPDSAALMMFVSRVLRATGDETTGVGLDTSSTYAARAFDAVRAGWEDGRPFDVGMYGRATLRALVQDMQAYRDGLVKIPAETPANQIPGEFHSFAAKLRKLQESLDRR